MEKEKTFKKAITNNLSEALEVLGYKRTLEQKGLVKFRNENNILTFVFEWNQTHAFYCQIQFDNEIFDYPLHLVMNRLNRLTDSSTTTFGGEFSKLVNEWTQSLSNELSESDISQLTFKSEVIQELRRELEQQTEQYNEDLEFDAIKQQVDDAWNSQNFEQFIKILNDRIADFPDSYSKKLSIAKKRI